ncbi:hypothetical protein FRX31_024564 [Thalictrum thalictroides]|uniref:Uncharacterized protein n=1 Tax=Thalictrum thalictroides TaxID=46969 RepID=A0A7J6VL56_THATH|nr:hypothetical protein FRX31_024564 [Thalictrum thalictroides]
MYTSKLTGNINRGEAYESTVTTMNQATIRARDRVCRFSKVESKIFEYVYFKGGENSAEVMLNERSKRGYFEVFTSKEGVRWLGRVLCSWSAGILTRQTEKFEDELVTILVHNRRNNNGEYAFGLFFNRRLGSRTKSISFPAGVERGGWAEIGSRMLECVEPTIFITQQRYREKRVERRGEIDDASKEETKWRGEPGTKFRVEKIGGQVSISIVGHDAVLNANKWQKAVMMEREDGGKEWEEVC